MRYTAALEPTSAHEIRAQAWQRPGITLRTTYRLEASGPATRLAERVEVEAPIGLRRFVATRASRAHAETLARLKTHFEG